MDFISFLKKFGGGSAEGLVGLELGVYEGDNALRWCNGGLRFKHLYLVDPYLKFSMDVYTSYGGHSQAEWTAIENRMKAKLGLNAAGEGACRGQPTTFLRMTSAEAAPTFADATFDFVYIDANHAYEFVKQDMELWYSKVRPGGWIMGHDWPYPSVQQAVNEFIAARKLVFHPQSGHLHGWHDWWFQRV